MKLATLLLLATLADAHSVLLKWAPSATASVPITYSVYRCTVVAGVLCTPATRIASSLTLTSFTDSTVVLNDEYMYGIEAVGPACVVGSITVCGTSAMLETPEPVIIASQKPSPPCATCTVTVTVTGKGIVAVVE